MKNLGVLAALGAASALTFAPLGADAETNRDDTSSASFASYSSMGELTGTGLNHRYRVASCAKVITLWYALDRLKADGHDPDAFIKKHQAAISNMLNCCPDNLAIYNGAAVHVAHAAARELNIDDDFLRKFLDGMNKRLQRIDADGLCIDNTNITDVRGGGYTTVHDLCAIMFVAARDFPEVFRNNVTYHNTFRPQVFNVCAQVVFGKPGQLAAVENYMGVLRNGAVIAVAVDHGNKDQAVKDGIGLAEATATMPPRSAPGVSVSSYATAYNFK